MSVAIHTTLVEAATLASHLGDPAWVVVDCRHDLANPATGETAYAQGHIPGAVFLHLDRDLSGPKSGRNGRHPLPEVAALAATLGRVGLGPGIQVVAYDDCGGMMAGRLWWLLRWLGHEAVALLDGGLPAWTAAGGALTAELPAPAVRTFTPAPRGWVLSAVEVLDGLGQPGRIIVDARAPDRFRGENETVDPVGGHIPGARNRFFRDNLGSDGRFKPAEQLRQEWAETLAGFAPEAVVHQCGSGVSACHNLLAMEIAGLPGSRLYAGSWSEWCADPARPVAR
ncbi:sulfurtransferase [Azospira sp. I13]|uniref:sulfurtransferase n=1 Tax=Azospira sp. I13 TaxID=1765050 RepID=UPI000D4A3338|nr:sulfurtransferase [Azospira sp. I13]GBG00980.1 sulfurtransferase [Azospira sp. I13]